MKHIILTCALALATTFSCVAAPVEIKGVKFNDTFEVANQALRLNGAGVRMKLFFNIYAASLYLPQKQTSSQGVLAQTGPKSVQAVLLRDLTAKEFVDAMLKGIRDNTSEAELTRLKPRLDALESMMLAVGAAPKGTAIHIDFVPGSGTRIEVDGKQRGEFIPGDDFYMALLKIWLGNKPADSDLKEALLSGR